MSYTWHLADLCDCLDSTFFEYVAYVAFSNVECVVYVASPRSARLYSTFLEYVIYVASRISQIVFYIFRIRRIRGILKCKMRRIRGISQICEIVFYILRIRHVHGISQICEIVFCILRIRCIRGILRVRIRRIRGILKCRIQSARCHAYDVFYTCTQFMEVSQETPFIRFLKHRIPTLYVHDPQTHRGACSGTICGMPCRSMRLSVTPLIHSSEQKNPKHLKTLLFTTILYTEYFGICI